MQSIVTVAFAIAALDRLLLYRTYVRELRRFRESNDCVEALTRYALLIRPRSALGGLRGRDTAAEPRRGRTRRRPPA